jgi:hypothetical protein
MTVVLLKAHGLTIYLEGRIKYWSRIVTADLHVCQFGKVGQKSVAVL